MTDRDVQNALEAVEIPAADEARDRSWLVVRAAWAEREPAPRPRPFLRPLLTAAVVAAIAAVAFTPPGRAVIDSVRETIGVERSQPALFSLPASGRLLVQSDAGAWIVHRDGGKRLLRGYRDATWSPRGRFVAAVRGRELVALEPDGDVRWKLARRGPVRVPSWSPVGRIRDDTRIAYVSGTALRVVGGDGRGDHVVARDVLAVRPAWRPRAEHVVAFATRAGSVSVAAADGARTLWEQDLGARATALEWSDDGQQLLAVTPRAVSVFDAAGRPVWRKTPSDATVPRGGTFVPRTHELTALHWHGTQTTVFWARTGRTLFTGPGRITDLDWSPDGRWLLLAWRDADQWLFVRRRGGRPFESVSSIKAQFGSRRFPALGGWCCR